MKGEEVEIMDGVETGSRNVSWFVGRMFNPEENFWVWIRRLANILTFPMLIMIGFIFIKLVF